jgi:lipoyl(octanoyl) transferase
MASSIATDRLSVLRCGTVDYQEAWNLQRRIAEDRRHDLIPDTLILLEHPHTYTLGRSGKDENILISDDELGERDIAVYHVDRGGDVTYHGPGQIVGYPILKLPAERRSRPGYMRAYIRDVELALLLSIRDLGVAAELKEGYSGIWVGEEKVCAIGVKIDVAGVTSHGFALNVATDLSYFDHIIPCGITDKGVTSLERLLGRRITMPVVEEAVIRRLTECFGLERCPTSTVGPLPRREHTGPAEHVLKGSAPAG